MRIIAGKYRGRVLQLPRNLPVRPTTDFAKEALFNVLTNRIELETMRVLDLCAGTGNLSIELLSRGVDKCTSVDLNYHCTTWLNSAKRTLGIENWSIQKEDALKFTKRCTEQFNFIIADPPYDWKYHQALVDNVFNLPILDRDGLFILEHGKANNFKMHPYFFEERLYGAVHFSFFKIID